MSSNFTQAMRDWLRHPSRKRVPLIDVVVDFGEAFNLSTEQMARILVEFIREEYATRPKRRLDS